MKQCLVIGRPNVGKTLFVIRLAQASGLRTIELCITDPAGERKTIEWPVETAIGRLSGPEAHQTLRLQSVVVALPMGKGVKRCFLVDSSGLTEGIHPHRNVRVAMAQTLAAVREADVIIHMIDAEKASRDGAVRAIGEVDYQVAQFAQAREAFLILANKMDLPRASIGLERIKAEFPKAPIVPLSALKAEGLEEVSRFVRRWI